MQLTERAAMREAGWVWAECKVRGLWADMPGLSDWIKLRVEACWRGSLRGEHISSGDNVATLDRKN